MSIGLQLLKESLQHTEISTIKYYITTIDKELSTEIMAPLITMLLTKNVFGFEQTYMNEILVTGPLCTSDCAGECRFSANLCKRALDVTANVIVETTRNADMLTINASGDFQ